MLLSIFLIIYATLSAFLSGSDCINCNTKDVVCLGEDPSDVGCTPPIEGIQPTQSTDNVYDVLTLEICRTFISGHFDEERKSIDWTLTYRREVNLTTFKFWLNKKINDSSVIFVVNVTDADSIEAFSAVVDPNVEDPKEQKLGSFSVGSFQWQNTSIDELHVHVKFKSNKSIASYLPRETVKDLLFVNNTNSTYILATVDLTRQEVFAHIQVSELNVATEVFQVQATVSSDLLDLFGRVSDDEKLIEEDVNELIEGHNKKINVRYTVGLTIGGVCVLIGIILMLYLTGGEPPQTIISSSEDPADIIVGVDNSHTNGEKEEEQDSNEREKKDE